METNISTPTIACKLNRKEWESKFFQKKIYALKIESNNEAKAIENELETLIDNVDYDIIECNLNVSDFNKAMLLENFGFKLIDSRITFLTLINLYTKKFDFPNKHKEYKVRYYKEEDLESVLKLTHEFLTYNKTFVSRFKNVDFFEESDAKRYFETWIKYSVDLSQSYTAVIEFEGQVIGFFIFEKKDFYKNHRLYKGILCAIDKVHQGKKLHLVMQSFLFNNFEENEFYLDNTTQISNYATVKNHIKSDRRLDNIQLTFMLKK